MNRRDPLQRVFRFKPHLCVHPISDEAVLVLDQRRQRLLCGRPHVLLAPLVDGRRSVEQLVEQLEPDVSAPEVFYLVEQLVAGGYLEQVTGEPPRLASPGSAYWSAVGLDAARAVEELARRPLQVTAVGDVDPAPLEAALQQLGVSLDPQAETAVVLVLDYLDPRLESINNHALARGQRWAPVMADGPMLWIGPLLGPPAACWACLAHRLRANRPVQTLARRLGVDPLAPAAWLPANRQIAVNLAALELARWSAGGGGGTRLEALLTLDLDHLELQQHPVIRRPRCEACGTPAPEPEPLRLRSRVRTFGAEGGFRVATPAETHERLRCQISPISGIVSSLGPVPGRDHPLRPVWAASWFACPPGQRPTPGALHRTSMGKGKTATQARTSALCEAIERWSAIFQGDEPTRVACLDDLDDAVHPHDLLHFSEAQYRRREHQPRDTERALQVPRPYHDTRAEIPWVPVWSLTHGRRRHVPAEHCYVDLALPPEQRCCPYDSNGDAAGNCLEEAVLQGLLELVERDAVALWWYSCALRPGVDLHAGDDPFLPRMAGHYRSLGWRLRVLDMTTELGLPVYVAYASAGQRFTLGCGCHPDARLAVQRAVTECNQLLDPAGKQPLPWDSRAIEDPAFLDPDPSKPLRRLHGPQEPLAEDLKLIIEDCVARLQRAGLETLVLDRTRPDAGLCTVKVLVPGLRHFWPRYGPGRLYEIPPKLGWVGRPLTEAQLNPVPLLI